MLTHIKVFVKPVGLYGVAVWGSQKCAMFRRLQLRHPKYVLSVDKLTSSMIIYGELGALPLHVGIHIRKQIEDENPKNVAMFLKLIICKYKMWILYMYHVHSWHLSCLLLNKITRINYLSLVICKNNSFSTYSYYCLSLHERSDAYIMCD